MNESIFKYGPILGQIMQAEFLENDKIIDEYQEQTILTGRKYSENEIVKVIKEDPLTYRFYINFLKREKPKITHLSSSFSYLPIFKYISNSKNFEYKDEIIYKNEIYIGKPHGFYSFPFGFLDFRTAKKSFLNSINLFERLDNGIINGVLKNNYLHLFNYIHKDMHEMLKNIKYIAETMGSTLSVAQGAALIKNNRKYVIMSDAEIEMGEFYENLLLQKQFLFDIVLLIDYNGWSKQNKTIIDIDDLRDMLLMFKQPAIIFDTRGFKEFFKKELK